MCKTFSTNCLTMSTGKLRSHTLNFLCASTFSQNAPRLQWRKRLSFKILTADGSHFTYIFQTELLFNQISSLHLKATPTLFLKYFRLIDIVFDMFFGQQPKQQMVGCRLPNDFILFQGCFGVKLFYDAQNIDLYNFQFGTIRMENDNVILKMSKNGQNQIHV